MENDKEPEVLLLQCHFEAFVLTKQLIVLCFLQKRELFLKYWFCARFSFKSAFHFVKLPISESEEVNAEMSYFTTFSIADLSSEVHAVDLFLWFCFKPGNPFSVNFFVSLYVCACVRVCGSVAS